VGRPGKALVDLVAERSFAPAPNPVSGLSRLDFSLDTEEPVSIRVYDVSGRLVTTVLDGTINGERCPFPQAAGRVAVAEVCRHTLKDSHRSRRCDLRDR
jgi:hypothetical protein